MKRNRRIKPAFAWRYLFGLLALLVIVGIVGEMEAVDAVKAEANYCEDVASGLYPDYKNNFQETCKNYEKGVDNIKQSD